MSNLPSLKVLNSFLDKSDGRDKLLATVQYAAMFISAGQAGDVKKVQASVATARKVFRIVKPLETLTPLILSPAIDGSKPLALEIINKLKPILMAIYFGADHVVWAQQAGLLQNKEFTARAQKWSLRGWLGGSLCTIIQELEALRGLLVVRPGESREAYSERMEKSRGLLNKRLFVLVHAAVQALLAMGLLELRPWKPRTVGLLGVIASVMNCYMLWPGTLPVSASPPSRPAATNGPAAVVEKKLEAKTT